LSALKDVPKLLPVEEISVSEEKFDWGTYLKEGLPSYHYGDSVRRLSIIMGFALSLGI